MAELVPTRVIELNPSLSVRAIFPTEEQTLVITKSVRAAQRLGGEASLTAVDVLFRVISTLLVDQEDADKIDTGLIDGSIRASDLMKIMADPEDDTDAKPAARARRRR